MMSWAMLVAERMHFSREEALSIGTQTREHREKEHQNIFVASVYTEMNAVTKGVSLGIYNKDTERGREAVANGSQPYVELIGRRYFIYLFTQSDPSHDALPYNYS